MSELFDELVAVAREAKCVRCDVPVIEAPGTQGIVMMNYFVPGVGKRERLFFCGPHGLEFREFLYPEILQDPVYAGAKSALQELFNRRGE